MWVPQEFNWFFKQSCWIGFFKKLSKCNNKEEITLLSELTLFSKTGAVMLIWGKHDMSFKQSVYWQ